MTGAEVKGPVVFCKGDVCEVNCEDKSLSGPDVSGRVCAEDLSRPRCACASGLSSIPVSVCASSEIGLASLAQDGVSSVEVEQGCLCRYCLAQAGVSTSTITGWLALLAQSVERSTLTTRSSKGWGFDPPVRLTFLRFGQTDRVVQ